MLLFLLLLISRISFGNGFTFYEWMERNSYICQDNNSFEPSFLSDEDAIQFNCESLCGNPLLTNQACSRLPSEPNEQPTCTTVPEICMLNFIQEFNDEKTFHLLLNPSPMDKELFKTTKEFFVPELIPPENEESENQDIDIQIIPITTTSTPSTTTTTQSTTTVTQPTTTQSTTQSTTTTTTPIPIVTTTTAQLTTTQNTTTQSTTTSQIISTSTTSQPTQTTSTPQPTQARSNTLLGFRININAVTRTFVPPPTAQPIPKVTPKFLSTTKKPLSTQPPKIVDNKVEFEKHQDFFISEFNQPERGNQFVDGHVSCSFWANKNECQLNPKYMLKVCRRSCRFMLNK